MSEIIIPKSPDEMPFTVHSDRNFVANALSSMSGYDCADLHYEIDHSASEAAGETVGQWDGLVEVRGKRFTAKHRDFINVLWYLTTVADEAQEKEYDRQQAIKAVALAKLTAEERRMLGL